MKKLRNEKKFVVIIAVCCGVRGRALASHTGVRRRNSRGGDCLLLFADYKLRSIYVMKRTVVWNPL